MGFKSLINRDAFRKNMIVFRMILNQINLEICLWEKPINVLPVGNKDKPNFIFPDQLNSYPIVTQLYPMVIPVSGQLFYLRDFCQGSCSINLLDNSFDSSKKCGIGDLRQRPDK